MNPFRRVSIILLLICSVSLHPVFAQTATPAKPVTTFSQKMKQSETEMRWSRIYYKSFRKTAELKYLDLASSHAILAINVLKEAQIAVPNTTTYYYKIKDLRFDACQHYENILAASRKLSVEHHLSKKPDLCE